MRNKVDSKFLFHQLGVDSLKCYEGRLNRTQTLDQLTETTCEKYQVEYISRVM